MKKILSVLLAAVVLISVLSANLYASGLDLSPLSPLENTTPDPEKTLMDPDLDFSNAETDPAAEGDEDEQPPLLYSEIPEGYFVDAPLTFTDVKTESTEWGARSEIQLIQSNFGLKPDDLVLVTLEDDDLSNVSIAFQSWYIDINGNNAGYGGNYYGTGLTAYGNYLNQLFLDGVTYDNLFGIQVIVNTGDVPDTVDKVTVTVARKEPRAEEPPKYFIPEGYTVIGGIEETDYEIVQALDENGVPQFDDNGNPIINDSFNFYNREYHFRNDDYILVTLDDASALNHNIGIMSFTNEWSGWGGMWSDNGCKVFGGFAGNLFCSGVTRENMQAACVCIGNSKVGQVIGSIKIQIARNLNETEPIDQVSDFLLSPGDVIQQGSVLADWRLPSWGRILQMMSEGGLGTYLSIHYSGGDDIALLLQYETWDYMYPSAYIPASEYGMIYENDDGTRTAFFACDDLIDALNEFGKEIGEGSNGTPFESMCKIFLSSMTGQIYLGANLSVPRSYGIPENYKIIDTFEVHDIVTVKSVWGDESKGEFSYTDDGAIPDILQQPYGLVGDEYILVTVYDSEIDPSTCMLGIQSYDQDWNGWGGRYENGLVIGAYVRDLFVAGVDAGNLKGINVDIIAPEEGLSFDTIKITVAIPAEWRPEPQVYSIPENYDVVSEISGTANAFGGSWGGFSFDKDVPGPFEPDDYVLVTVSNGYRFSDIGMNIRSEDWSKSNFTDEGTYSTTYGAYIRDLVGENMTVEDAKFIYTSIYFYGEDGQADYTIQIAKPHKENRYEIPEGATVVTLGANNEYAPLGKLPAQFDRNFIDFNFGSDSSDNVYSSAEFLKKVETLSVSFEVAAIIDPDGMEIKDDKDVLDRICFYGAVESGTPNYTWETDYSGLRMADNGKFLYEIAIRDLVSKDENIWRISLGIDSLTYEDGSFALPVGSKVVLTNVKWTSRYLTVPDGYDVVNVVESKSFAATTLYDDGYAECTASTDIAGPFEPDDYIQIEVEESEGLSDIYFQLHDDSWQHYSGYSMSGYEPKVFGMYAKDMYANTMSQGYDDYLQIIFHFGHGEDLHPEGYIKYRVTVLKPHKEGRYDIPEGDTVVTFRKAINNETGEEITPNGYLPAIFENSDPDFGIRFAADSSSLIAGEAINNTVESISVSFDYITVVDKDGFEIKDPSIGVNFWTLIQSETWSWDSDWSSTVQDGSKYTVTFNNLAERVKKAGGVRAIAVGMTPWTSDENPLGLPGGSKVILGNVKWDIKYREFIPGDVNGDKQITLDDAILTLKSAMNTTLSGETFLAAAADVSGDGEITLDDSIAILKMAMNVAQ